MNGIYAMYFTGTAGAGHAVFVMKDGEITGADAIGGVLDGTYKEVGDGQVEVTVKLTIPPGALLVTGAIAGQEPMSQVIEATLPGNFAEGETLPVKTPTGPVNVIFKRLRELA